MIENNLPTLEHISKVLSQSPAKFRRHEVIQSISGIFQIHNLQVLEIGAGPGLLLWELASRGANIFYADSREIFKTHAQSLFNCTNVKGNFITTAYDNLPYSDKSMDLVIIDIDDDFGELTPRIYAEAVRVSRAFILVINENSNSYTAQNNLVFSKSHNNWINKKPQVQNNAIISIVENSTSQIMSRSPFGTLAVASMLMSDNRKQASLQEIISVVSETNIEGRQKFNAGEIVLVAVDEAAKALISKRKPQNWLVSEKGTLVAKSRPSPLISIITPSYNCASYLPRAIKSVVKQSYQNYELLIIDDGSTDETNIVTNDFITRYKDLDIQYFKKENGGPSSAKNYGMRVASGKYFIELDSDDELSFDQLSEQVSSAIQFGQPDFCFYPTFALIDEDYNELGQFYDYDIYLHPHLVVKDQLITGHGRVPTPGTLHPLEPLRKFPFDESMTIGEDTDHRNRYIAEGLITGFIAVPTALYRYMLRSTGLTVSLESSEIRAHDTCKMLRNAMSLFPAEQLFRQNDNLRATGTPNAVIYGILTYVDLIYRHSRQFTQFTHYKDYLSLGKYWLQKSLDQIDNIPDHDKQSELVQLKRQITYTSMQIDNELQDIKI